MRKIIPAVGHITREAGNKKFGFTLDEVADMVDTAREMGIAGGTRFEIWANWRQSFYKARVEGPVIDGQREAEDERGPSEALSTADRPEANDGSAGTPES
jgi:hypothetical protein